MADIKCSRGSLISRKTKHPFVYGELHIQDPVNSNLKNSFPTGVSEVLKVYAANFNGDPVKVASENGLSYRQVGSKEQLDLLPIENYTLYYLREETAYTFYKSNLTNKFEFIKTSEYSSENDANTSITTQVSIKTDKFYIDYSDLRSLIATITEDLKEIFAETLSKVINNINTEINSACPYPCGATYSQYPGQKAPEDLWPSTFWEKLDYEGAFFRASGGDASDFISSKITSYPCYVYMFEGDTKYYKSETMETVATIPANKTVKGAIKYKRDSTTNKWIYKCYYMLDKDSAGVKQAESLPNIKGSLLASSSYTGTGEKESGALYWQDSETNLKLNFLGTTTYGKWAGFDASKSNSVYKDNAKVTPENYTKIIWLRVN
jgi:hypothetical protein